MNANPINVWEGSLHFLTMPRSIAFNLIACVLFALSIASTVSLTTFMSSLAAAVCVILIVALGSALLNTITIMILSKLNFACTTTLDEHGIRDSLGPVKLNYKWHQISDVKMKNGNVYLIALFNGIHVPVYAFADHAEGEDFVALAKHYQAAAHQKKNQITAGGDPHVPDPDFLLRSLHAEEEAKWREIEKKHEGQNRN
jgi:hypothetical protein